MANSSGPQLPIEIWEEIFGYLTTSDVINFSKASNDFQYFLLSKDIVRNFNICGDYNFADVSLYNFIKENVAYEHIKSLNVNKLYWVELDEMRRLVKFLPSLEELFALNTRLSLRQKDVVLYTKLKTLAVSIEGSHFVTFVSPLTYKNNLYLLRRLCLHISSKHSKSYLGLGRLFCELYALQELWIYDSDDTVPNAIRYDVLVVHLKFLTKLVIKSRVNIPFLDYKPFGLAKYFESRRFKSIVMRYERFNGCAIVPFKDVSIFEPYETKLENAWEVFRKFRSEMPYSPAAHREVYLTNKINNIQFKELNFFHNKCFCVNEYVQASLEFLRSKNSRMLEKLSIKTCLLQREIILKRHSLSNLNRKYPILEVIENCPNVTTLEVMQCTSCNVTIIDAFPLLCKWVNLERFTLEVPAHLNGKFLVDLLRTCKQLKLLKIVSYNTNEDLNRSINKALPYGNALETFCYENKFINLWMLFNSLCQLNSHKLRRLCITCDDIEEPRINYLRTFLSNNTQLLFFYVSINRKSKNFMTHIQLVMDGFKTNPAQVYVARKDPKMMNIPLAYREFLTCDTEVACVDFYEFR